MNSDSQNPQPTMTVEEVRGSLDLTDSGAIKNSIRNCLTVFQNDPYLQGAVRYNILTERIDIVKPLWWSKQTATLNDTDLNYLMLYLEDKYGLTSEKKIQKAISIVADCNQYHPIRDYLNSLEWDGTERIRYALTRFLGAEDSEYTYQCLRLFMLGAISRVFKPGCKFEVMLCLVGGQGAGKSTFFRLLAVKDEWFSDDLKKIDDDNVYRKMQGHWIIEMSEMIATANAKSIEDIKSFISSAKETYKVPYETHPADRLRQCVFGGSSNTMDFLPLDRSGNRRFLPIMVHPENAVVHILEDEAASRAFIDLMWAEAMFIYHNFPVKLTLSKDMDKELKELQKQFMPEDTKAGLTLVSDISHQVKTPVSNLKMATDTLLEKPMTEAERTDFIRGIRSQTDKLDFLFQALVKTSRLETGVIQLDKKPGRLFDTVAQAMSGIVYAAEKKEIAVSVDCPEDLTVSHDSKWTSEALFNLLDNAVKYTPAGGKIAVSVVLWEMYVEIKVTDTGKGISESNQAAIFRRFYREEEVHEQQGVGIGLYLAREIVTRQGGYIKVVSEPGRGSEFSIMLPTK